MTCGKYPLAALRIVVGAFWLNADIPRWIALAGGRPAANQLVRIIFGSNMVVPLTYFFTLLETIAAVALILGLFVRLAAVWAIIQYAIIDGLALFLLRNTSQDLLFTLLLVVSLVLLANGSSALSLDGLIAKRKQNA
jgi:uncharacterized membrane protein YphA (DoxX/SURF4 family)